MNRFYILFILLFSNILCNGQKYPECNPKCADCIIGTSNLVMALECDVTNFGISNCVKFIGNELGPYICGSIEEVKYYIYQQCENKLEIPMLARNLAIGVCSILCKENISK